MKYRMHILTALFALAANIDAQTDDSSGDSAITENLSLKKTIETINDVDAQFQARQAEVLGEVDVSTENASMEAPSAVPSPEVAIPDSANPPSQGAASVELYDEGLPTLPDSIDGDSLPVGEVYIQDESPVEGSAELESDTISVDFPNEDVRQIIRNVADLYELNVVIPETLVGSVSIKLRDVSWRQVFNVVLEPLSFTWVQDGNIIKIKSIDDILAEPVATRVFIINYATAGEIQGSISPMVDAAAGGRLQVDTRSNALVITERPSRMNDIQAIIDRLDRPTDQVMIESKFVEVTQRDERNLGINWAALNGYELSAGPFDRQTEKGNSTNTENRSQSQFGSDFDLSTGNLSVINTDLTEALTENLVTDSRLDTALFSAAQFQVILSALETNNDVELVSNPTVVTMNNTVAQINIGEEFPIPEYRYNEERGTFEVAGFEYKPIGILLNVTPQVNSAGFINLAIKPEISSRTGEVNFGGAGGAAIPIVTTRKTESTVTIKSGYTLAIGGLMETQTGKTENKVPVLGDIPFIGRAFRSNTDTLDGRNLIIFITAKVLNPDGSTYRDVFDDRDLIEMGISHRDVPGFEPEPEEKALFEELQNERDRLETLRSETSLKEQLMLIEKMRQQAIQTEEQRLEREFNERLLEWEKNNPSE